MSFSQSSPQPTHKYGATEGGNVWSGPPSSSSSFLSWGSVCALVTLFPLGDLPWKVCSDSLYQVSSQAEIASFSTLRCSNSGSNFCQSLLHRGEPEPQTQPAPKLLSVQKSHSSHTFYTEPTRNSVEAGLVANTLVWDSGDLALPPTSHMTQSNVLKRCISVSLMCKMEIEILSPPSLFRHQLFQGRDCFEHAAPSTSQPWSQVVHLNFPAELGKKGLRRWPYSIWS